MVLCKSTIISTSGVAANPAWLHNFITNGSEIHCGFDTDKTGDMIANKMIKQYPSIKKLRPPCHDWKKVLQQNFHPLIQPPIWTTKIYFKTAFGDYLEKKDAFFVDCAVNQRLNLSEWNCLSLCERYSYWQNTVNPTRTGRKILDITATTEEYSVTARGELGDAL